MYLSLSVKTNIYRHGNHAQEDMIYRLIDIIIRVKRTVSRARWWFK